MAAAAAAKPHGLLREANALLNIAFTVGAAAGPAIAGLVVAGAGARTALSPTRSLPGRRGPVATASRPSADQASTMAGSIERMRRGPRLRARPRPHCAGSCSPPRPAAFVFFALVIPIEVVFAKQTLDAGDAGYGALLASLGGRHGRRQP